jgi:hypothetical protein
MMTERVFRMQNAVNMLMLVSATAASLAFGVLAAYWICRAAFAGLTRHAGMIRAERAKAQIAPASQA